MKFVLKVLLLYVGYSFSTLMFTLKKFKEDSWVQDLCCTMNHVSNTKE